MTTLQITATVAEDGTVTGKAPPSVPPGEHRLLILLDESEISESGARRFPNLSAFRESLGAPSHPGNTILEMREEERA